MRKVEEERRAAREREREKERKVKIFFNQRRE